jgi:hypothetical protein
MAHQSYTAPSIGDRVTGMSLAPETTKSTPLLWPARTIEASIRMAKASDSDCLRLTPMYGLIFRPNGHA